MRSRTTAHFRKQLARIPTNVQEQAKRTYRVWRTDPYRNGLEYGRVHPSRPYYSVRIGLHWRAVALVENGLATWIWIGSHSDYDKLLDSL